MNKKKNKDPHAAAPSDNPLYLRTHSFLIGLEPPFYNAKQRIDQQEGIIIALQDKEGYTGYGEASLITTGGHESALVALHKESRRVVPILVQTDFLMLSHDVPVSKHGLLERMTAYGLAIEAITDMPCLRWGLWMAGFDLMVQKKAYTVPSFTVKSSALLEENDADIRDVNRHRIHRLIADGWTTLKIKIGRRTVMDDLHFLRHMHAAFAGRIRWILDCNGAWTLRDMHWFIKRAIKLPIMCIEDPLSNPMDYKKLSKEALAFPITLDKHVRYREALRQDMPHLPLGKVMKPMQIGSFTEIRAWVENDRASPTMISACFETRIGFWGLMMTIHLLGLEDSLHGLDTMKYLRADHPLYAAALMPRKGVLKGSHHMPEANALICRQALFPESKNM